jgi:hypothetical protein
MAPGATGTMRLLCFTVKFNTLRAMGNTPTSTFHTASVTFQWKIANPSGSAPLPKGAA